MGVIQRVHVSLRGGLVIMRRGEIRVLALGRQGSRRLGLDTEVSVFEHCRGVGSFSRIDGKHRQEEGAELAGVVGCQRGGKQLVLQR